MIRVKVFPPEDKLTTIYNYERYCLMLRDSLEVIEFVGVKSETVRG